MEKVWAATGGPKSAISRFMHQRPSASLLRSQDELCLDGLSPSPNFDDLAL